MRGGVLGLGCAIVFLVIISLREGTVGFRIDELSGYC